MISNTSLRAISMLAGISIFACSSTDSPGTSGGSSGTWAGGGSSADAGKSGASAGNGNIAGANSAGASTGGASTAGSGSSPAGAAGASATGGSSSGTSGASNGGGGGAAPSGGSPGTAGGAAMTGGFPENTGAACTATAGVTKANPKLPNPFAMHDGTVITTKAQWECRRNEIKKDLEKFEIGPKQEPAMVKATLSGKMLSVVVTNSAGSLTLSSTVSGSGSCVAIGMNGASGILSGCTQIPFMHDQIVKYAQDSTQSKSDPFYKLYPDLFGKIGNYSAWSWGISRLIDGIEQVKDQLMVNPAKIGVQGCSYAGKMALFGGALDERIALTVAEESGGGGINSWRTSQDFNKRTGTSIEKIDNTNYAWFMSSMKGLDPYSLPHDHHELVAMVAPRAFIALGNADYEWLGDESGYKSLMAAQEVWKAMGVADHFGYDFTSGHDHCQAPAVQTASVKTFADRYLRGTSTTSSVAIKPTSTKFDLTYALDWQTPTLQ